MREGPFARVGGVCVNCRNTHTQLPGWHLMVAVAASTIRHLAVYVRFKKNNPNRSRTRKHSRSGIPPRPRGTEWTRPTQSCTSAYTAKSMLSPLGLSALLEVTLDYSFGSRRYADLSFSLSLTQHVERPGAARVLWPGGCRWKAIVLILML